MKKTLLTMSAFVLGTWAMAQNPGDLDQTFGVNGYVVTDPYANIGELYWDMITLSNDKIVKVGYTSNGGSSDILIARFNEDGTPDDTFGTGGFLVIDLSLGGAEDARGVYELASGQLLVTGIVETPNSLDAYVMRLNEDGTIDNSFGTSNGHTKLNTSDNTLAYGKTVLEYGGEIYVGGSVSSSQQFDLFVCNLTLGGGIDNSFSSSGYAKMDIDGGNDNLNVMAIQSNGSFILGGYADSLGTQIGFVASLSQFGTPTSFGTNGEYHINFGVGSNKVNDLLVDDANGILLVGDQGAYPNVNGFMLRLTPTGTLDLNWGSNGMVMSDPGATTALYLRGITETLDGGYVAAGNFDGASQSIYFLMVDAQGNLNGNFGGNGDVITPLAIQTTDLAIVACAMQSSGKIIAGGYLASQDFSGNNMIMIRILPFASLGIEESEDAHFEIYPNPASDSFQVGLDHVKTVELIDVSGKSIVRYEGQSTYELPSDLTSGVYVVRVTTESSVGLARIMVK